MKPVRTLIIALLGYAAAIVPGISQAHDVTVSLPGISVRLPAPPILLPLPVPQIVVRGGSDHGPEYRREAPRYYREDWRHERWDDHRHEYYDRHDQHDHDHDHDGWHR
jgi:hypothetical protein